MQVIVVYLIGLAQYDTLGIAIKINIKSYSPYISKVYLLLSIRFQLDNTSLLFIENIKLCHVIRIFSSIDLSFF